MKKLLGTVLLSSILLAGCAAGVKDAAVSDHAAMPEACDFSMDEKTGSAAYSMERAAVTGGEPSAATEAAAETDYFDNEPLIYVTFSQYSDSLTADDGTKLFISQCYVPSFKTQDDAVDDWIAYSVEDAALQTWGALNLVKELAETDYQNREDGTSADFYTYSYYSNVNTERLDSKVFSVLQVNSTYCGGAHPNYSQTAYNVDLTEQTQLSLADVIEPEGAGELLERLLEELQRRLNNLKNFGLLPDYQETIESYFSDPELTPDWYFNDKGRVIYFNCYDIAPIAAGIIKVEFLYDTLVDVLKPEYFPKTPAGGEGSAMLLDSPGERSVLEVPSEGAYFYIGTEQTIYDLKIYHLSGWVTEDLPIVGQMVFAANRLTGEEAIEIAQSETARMPEYLLTFRNAAGQVCTLAAEADELREITTVIAE